MAAEFDVGPSRKKSRLVFDQELCIFCDHSFSKTPGVTPDLSRINSLFSACKERLDSIGNSILAHEQQIRDGEITFRYHRDCRATYCSSMHIKRAVEKRSTSLTLGVGVSGVGGESVEHELDSASSSNLRLTRSITGETSFDWKSNCFICGEICQSKLRSTWSMVSSLPDKTGKGTLYTRILQAAEDRNDIQMITRLRGVVNGDLVAAEARYHRKKNCIASYTNARNISAKQNYTARYEVHHQALQQLQDEFCPKLENKQVFLLSTLRTYYQKLLDEMNVDSSGYTSQKLKRKLEKSWPSIVFIPRKGESDLVCSKEISVGDALRKASELSSDQAAANEDAYESVDDEGLSMPIDEERIVHQAVGILRKRMSLTTKLDSEYFSAGETSLQAQRDFLDPLVYKAVGWMINGKKYAQAEDTETDTRCLSIACDITTLSSSVYSPKHLSLAVYLHHNFGSRKLIDALHALGYCISYTELRKFLTSAAIHVDAQQQSTALHAYVPPELTPVNKGGQMILSAADNWDHNENTLDGKKTTHGMTSILIQPGSSTDLPSVRIKRDNQRTLDTTKLRGGDLSETIPYRKPSTRPQPVLSKPISMNELKPPQNNEAAETSKTVELLYDVARSGVFHETTGCIPPWSAFHVAICSEKEKNIPVSQVAYNPIIMAPSSDVSTVYTVLLRLRDAARALGHKYLPVCFDMGLLSKALEITWARPDEFEGVILVEGGMHLLMSVIAAVGYLYGDAGLRNLLHDSGVFGARTVEHMLSGKDFARAIYGLKLIEEVLCTQFLLNFRKWCEHGNINLPPTFGTLLADLESCFVSNDDPRDVVESLCSLMQDDICPLMEAFRKDGCTRSPTFKLWDDILFRVLLPVKRYISATRHGIWNAQQFAKYEFLPLLFSANRTNYARYLPVQLLALRRIPDEVEQELLNGSCSVKLSKGIFNGVWLDYTLETTENKDLKGAGGIIGLTMRGASLTRWFLARPVTATYAAVFKNSMQSDNTRADSKEQKTVTSSERRWNADVKKVQELFTGPIVDPFALTDPPSQLINIATGAVAPDLVQESLCSALEKGETMLDKFVSERLASDTPKSLFDPLPRSKIKTMTDMKKKVKIKTKSVQLNGELLYLRLLAVNSVKKVPLQRVMSFENAPVPVSIFHEDGTMTSCVKSEFMHKLEEVSCEQKITALDTADAVIFDGHAVIQTLAPPNTTLGVTYNKMAEVFESYIVGVSKSVSPRDSSPQIHVAFDRYLPDSIKSQTREQRSAGKTNRVYQVRGETTIPPDWKQFLSVSENKSNLANHYTDHLMQNKNLLAPNQPMYVTGGKSDDAVMITEYEISICKDLVSDQEESDTRMILHAVKAAESGAKVIVVCSPDTDVLILLLHHRPSIKANEIYFRTGRQGKYEKLTRFIPVHRIFAALSDIQRSLMLPIYGLTGCDTVSAFFGHGKKQAFRILMKPTEKCEQLASLGDNLTITTNQLKGASHFVCTLYGDKKCESLNELRCKMAEKGIPIRKLPPTEDSFFLHLQRCTYQVYLWKHATTASLALPPPTKYGYEKEDGLLKPKMMTQESAPPELLNNILCECLPQSCQSSCTCFTHGQPCTSACCCEAILEELDEDNFCRNTFTTEVYRDRDHDGVDEVYDSD